MTTQLLDSEIVYSSATRDYDILIAGVICASARTYSEAEAVRTRVLAERRDEGRYATAAELDDPPPSDEPEAVNWNSRSPLARWREQGDAERARIAALAIPSNADPAPCPTCAGDGRLCYDCGSLDTPAIGRKLVQLMHEDRPTLLKMLNGTQRQFWPLLAQSYVAALGPTESGVTVPALGVVGLWGLLVNEANAKAHS